MPAFLPGDRIGKYVVVRPLGRGGMGELYLTRDESAHRQVVVKLVLSQDPDPALTIRFLREARTAAALRHVNIVTVYEVGEHEGRPFMAMEYIAGETLSSLIGRRADLDINEKLRILEEVCAGLAAAHRIGVVHRDLKPSNIMLDSDGVVRLLDFGIAKIQADTLTHEGVLLGTIHYMSPEQFEGQVVDHRSDIFSLGAVAYELLTYERAYPGSSLREVAARIVTGRPPVPMRELQATIPPHLDDIVRRALSAAPDLRYQSVAEFQADLALARSRASDRTVASERTLVLPVRSGAAQTHGEGSHDVPTRVVTHGLLADDDQLESATRRRWLIPAVFIGLGLLVTVLAWSQWLAGRESSDSNVPSTSSGIKQSGDQRGAQGDASGGNAPTAQVQRGPSGASTIRPRGDLNDRTLPLTGPEEGGSAASTAAVSEAEVEQAEGDAANAESSAAAAEASIRAEEQFASAQESLADAREARRDGDLARALELNRVAAARFREAQRRAAESQRDARVGQVPAGIRGDDERIRSVLSQYEAAFSTMSAAAVKRAVPGLSADDVRALDRGFLEARAYELSLEDVRIARDGDRARVSARMRRIIQTRSGDTRDITTNAQISLERVNDDWAIVRVVER